MWQDVAERLLGLLSNAESYLVKGKTRRILWLELCDMLTQDVGELGFNVDAVIRLGIQELPEGNGSLWTSWAGYYISRDMLERARDIVEEGMTTVTLLTDFSVVLNDYFLFDEENMPMESDKDCDEEVEEDDDPFGGANLRRKLEVFWSSDGNALLDRFEYLVDRNPLLANSVLLIQNTQNVKLWHRRARLFPNDHEKQISVYNEATLAVHPTKAEGKPHTLWVSLAKLYESQGKFFKARSVFEDAVKINFKDTEHQVEVWCQWTQMEIKIKNYGGALKLLRPAHVESQLKSRGEVLVKEHQVIQQYSEIAADEFPDEFQCCVCLDIMFKPVVLVCGHSCCFLCVFKAMDSFQESHCFVCRKPYIHFPRICQLLHNLLLKLYPRQVAEEEKKHGHASPKCENYLTDSQVSANLSVGDSSSPHLGSVRVESNANKDNSVVEHSSQVLVTDLQCAVCKHLLCRPVVLNCGHVYCEACIDPHDSVCICPVCQSAHPNGFPRVCLILEHFLEERFPKEYSARKESLRNFQSAGPSGKEQEEEETRFYSAWFSDNEPNFHPGVGCDDCGMYPIIGTRYRCQACVGISFDLCQSCYGGSSKLGGRFNQQHTEEHHFLIVRPPSIRNIMFRM